MLSKIEDMWANKVHQQDIMGMHPFGWIPRAERFFEDQDIIHIINVVVFTSMEGHTMLWFQSWCQEDLDADWVSFSIVVIRKFNDRI